MRTIEKHSILEDDGVNNGPTVDTFPDMGYPVKFQNTLGIHQAVAFRTFHFLSLSKG